MFNFQWGKTIREGTDHLITIPYDERCYDTCPIRAVEQWIALGEFIGGGTRRKVIFSLAFQRTERVVNQYEVHFTFQRVRWHCSKNRMQ